MNTSEVCRTQKTYIENIFILDFFTRIFPNKPEQNASRKAYGSLANK